MQVVIVMLLDRPMLRDAHKVELLHDSILQTVLAHCAYRCGGGSKPSAGRLLVAAAINKMVQLRLAANRCMYSLQQLATDYGDTQRQLSALDWSLTDNDF